METIKELEAEKKLFEKAYEAWNNKKLDDDVRRKAERHVDECCDNGRTNGDLNKLIKQLKDVLELIDEEIRKAGINKFLREKLEELKKRITG